MLPGGLIAALLFSGAMMGAAPTLADSKRTYLDLSHDTMRQQLATNDLEAAARTLSWIRRADRKTMWQPCLPPSFSCGVAMSRLPPCRFSTSSAGRIPGRGAVLEAQRVLTDLGDAEGLAGVIVTDAMLDDAAFGFGEAPQSLFATDEGAFAYTVATVPQSDPDQVSRLLAFAPTTPAIEMAKAAGRAPTTSIPGAPALDATTSGVAAETAALRSVPPTAPDGGPPALIDLVFENPADLELNFALFQEQMATNGSHGASATLERVLLIDPRSKLAKVPLADVNRKGDLIQARSILRTLLAEEDTPLDMAARAEAIAEEVESRSTRSARRHALRLRCGQYTERIRPGRSG